VRNVALIQAFLERNFKVKTSTKVGYFTKILIAQVKDDSILNSEFDIFAF
jgi:hypothetical protein